MTRARARASRRAQQASNESRTPRLQSGYKSLHDRFLPSFLSPFRFSRPRRRYNTKTWCDITPVRIICLKPRKFPRTLITTIYRPSLGRNCPITSGENFDRSETNGRQRRRPPIRYNASKWRPFRF